MENETQAAGQVSVEGILEKIVFTSEETGFTVGRLRCDAEGRSVTVVGTIMSAHEGERLRITGTWQSHPKYGRQLAIAQLQIVLPTKKEAIEKYLASGRIKGIGPKLAERIVTELGDDTLKILAEHPEKLLRIRGIGKKKLEEIAASWHAQKASHDAMLFLANYGIGGARAVKIYKEYGNNLISVIKHHPYRLANDIDGIGFLTADRIARQSGVAVDDIERVQAGVLHLLREATNQGHCYVPTEELCQVCAKLLQLEPEQIEVSLASFPPNTLQRLEESNRPVYLTKLLFEESQVAHLLKRLATTPMTHSHANLEEIVSRVEREMKLTFPPSQREAIQTGLSRKVCVITGGPGVGKTTIIKALVQILTQNRYRIALAAPTGRAAKRLSEAAGWQASTIHRLLHYNPRNHSFEYNADHQLEIDHLIIDETSMLDISLSYRLLAALPVSCSVTFVGDADQLPSVGPGNFLKDCIESQTIPIIKLSYIFRQAQGSSIVAVAHQINSGIVPNIPAQATGDICLFPLDDPEQGAALIVDLVANQLPRHYHFHPLTDIQVLTPMYRGEVGADNLNLVLAQQLNPNGVALANNRFRQGDKIMQIVNNYDKDVYNGDIGVIQSYNRIEQTVTIVFDGRPVNYQENELDDVMRAYAISIHKSQGSEYPAVVIPIFSQHYIMLERNLLYTAITRGKKLVILIGSHKALGIAVRTIKAKNRYTRLAGLLQV